MRPVIIFWACFGLLVSAVSADYNYTRTGPCKVLMIYSYCMCWVLKIFILCKADVIEIVLIIYLFLTFHRIHKLVCTITWFQVISMTKEGRNSKK